MNTQSVEVLQLSLHGFTVGYLLGYQNGQNILEFDAGFISNQERPTLTLSAHFDHPSSARLFSEPWARRQRLHPVLSNLLPEGVLRDWLAQVLKVHPDNEFPLFSALADDLPGALMARPLDLAEVPPELLQRRPNIQLAPRTEYPDQLHFSLAGIQMKFSMHQKDGRFTLSRPGKLGDWIIKTPSTRFKNVPQNEFTAMSLAKLVGIDIPDISLVSIDELEDLPSINLPDEEQAFAIRRFDRDGKLGRIHMEDFAQVLFKYAHDKYRVASTEQIGKIVYGFTGRRLANIQQMARRLLVNVLLGNGDAHIKNWSLFYPDRITAELAPAYDIVFTKAYIKDERKVALNMAGNKNWYAVNMSHFESWANSVGVPWRAVKPHLNEVLDTARSLWPGALDSLPMADEHKSVLRQHWQVLHPDFRFTDL